MIKLSNIEKVYQTSNIETLALNNINIDIKKGEFVSIMGPSGCGKSTLLNILLQLNAAGSTIVMVTHDENMAKKTHRLIRLFDGTQVS